MIAIGTGAEAAIQDQIRAAGMNLIVVTAGNYKMKSTDDFGGGAVEPSAALRQQDDVGAETASQTAPARSQAAVGSLVHVADAARASRRRSDGEARSSDGARSVSATAKPDSARPRRSPPADADAIRGIRGVQYVAEGLHQNVHVKAGDKRWFTRLHGTDVRLPLIRRAWTLRERPLLQRRRAVASRAGDRARQRGGRSGCSATRIRSAATSRSGISRSGSSAW